MPLYHASTNKSLQIISPQPTLSNNQYIGDYVFATANRTLAIMYLVPKGIPTLMDPDNQTPTIVISSDPAYFKTRDKGGAIYGLPSESFTATPQKGLSDYEMASKVPVKPIRKIPYKSALNALLSAGIKVVFVNTNMFHHLICHPEQKAIMRQLKGYPPPQ